MTNDVYARLAFHMSSMAIGPPFNEYLVQIIRETLTREEAEILLRLPTQLAPLEPVSSNEISQHFEYSASELETILDSLAARGMLFRVRHGQDKKGYALHQFGYGMPQTIFWPNEDTPFARRMAELCIRHSSSEGLTGAFGGTGTKVYRWIPTHRGLAFNKQSVLPYANIEQVIASTSDIAVVNCNCRVMSRLKGREPCAYPLDVCMKYDELAEYVVDTGIGRQVSKDEAIALNLKAEEAGCVHFADNVMEGEIKHACNCCPCCCWSLGNFKRRRIPRDFLMACQFIRETDPENCTGCGACVEACPIDAVWMRNGVPEVDYEWCIGCGVCTLSCPTGASAMVRRDDVESPLPDLKCLIRERIAGRANRAQVE